MWLEKRRLRTWSARAWLASGGATLLVAAVFHPPVAFGQAAAGTADDALAGIERVGIAGSTRPLSGAVSGTLGYGFTESVLGDDRGHHRLAGSLAGGFSVARWLALSLMLDGQYDRHVGGVDAGDDGFIGRSRLAARTGFTLEEGLGVGAELAARLPGAKRFGDALSGASLEADAMVSYAWPGAPMWLSASAGFLLDRSVDAIQKPERLRQSDRLALGLNDSNAVLLALGGLYDFGLLSAYAEWRWEVRVGGQAPAALQSPMWLTAGAKTRLDDALGWRLSVSVSPSARPSFAPSDPLTTIQPRVWLTTGLVYRFDVAPTKQPPTGGVSGRVLGPGGKAVQGALVRVSEGGPGVTTGAEGQFRVDRLPAGARELTIELPGWRTKTVPIRIADGELLSLQVELELMGATVSGVVRGRDESPVEGAVISLTHASGDHGRRVTSGHDGSYVIEDVAPGEYELEVVADGWRDYVDRLTVTSRQPMRRDVVLDPPLPAGQIRGHVRNFGGRGVDATVRIEPAGIELETDEQGRFDVDVPPGRYRVRVRARGYRPQTRPVVVEQHGVTVLILELRGRR